jgi:hypothetical protein
MPKKEDIWPLSQDGYARIWCKTMDLVWWVATIGLLY